MTTKGAVMSRAWEIFRVNCNYPAVPFRSIGRHNFAVALRMAWQEVREAAELAATPTQQLTALADTYERELTALQFAGWATNVQRQRDTINAALTPIKAELAKREPEPVALALAA